MGHSISEKLTQFKDKFYRAWIRRSELDALHTTIKELRTKKGNLKSRIAELESNVEAGHSEILCRDAGIADLQAKLETADANAVVNNATIKDLTAKVASLIRLLDDVEVMLDELDVELTANLEAEE